MRDIIIEPASPCRDQFQGPSLLINTEETMLILYLVFNVIY